MVGFAIWPPSGKPRSKTSTASKRADYFAAGTLVVWDVDVLTEHVVRVYRAGDPLTPTTYRSGEPGEAEPALPGWSMAVDDLVSYKQA